MLSNQVMRLIILILAVNVKGNSKIQSHEALKHCKIELLKF